MKYQAIVRAEVEYTYHVTIPDDYEGDVYAWVEDRLWAERLEGPQIGVELVQSKVDHWDSIDVGKEVK